MKVVIFAGGLGTRISEETGSRPKPMVDIGGKPILWHIMKMYSQYGYDDFIICLGYKGYLIKEYFMHYYLHNSDITIEVGNNRTEVHSTTIESFKVTLVNTGEETKTAGRLQQVARYINDDTFMLTYGDGLADIYIPDLVSFHQKHGKIATVTAVQPEARFGGLVLDDKGKVVYFKEKPTGDGKWINGGFFVLSRDIFKYLQGDMSDIMWEDDPMERLSNDGQLMAYRHRGFWKCMDAMRDKIELESLWENNQAKWKTW